MSRISRMDASTGAAEVRALVPPPRDVEAPVREILAAVRERGDAAVAELTARFDGVRIEPDALRVPAEELEAAAAALDPDVGEALETAIANVRAVAEAGLAPPSAVRLAQGHQVELVELPVRRAAAYVPGGRAPYPSTVVMYAIPAHVAGVEQLVVCAPPGADGAIDPAILAACHVCGVAEVYRMGGAQAIGALAYGTERVGAVDMIVGPGNAYTQEAKLQLSWLVGIDGIKGPSDVVVVASSGADAELIALDLLAQAEHGADSLVCAISDDRDLLDAVERCVGELAASRPSVAEAALALVERADPGACLELAEQIAPEHLELVGAPAEALAGEVRSAGCLFVGRDAATAFGDYVAGSNHVLPTGGSARFESALSAATFRRRMARVSLPPGAAARLAPAGAALARAEGFPVHAESMERRS